MKYIWGGEGDGRKTRQTSPEIFTSRDPAYVVFISLPPLQQAHRYSFRFGYTSMLTVRSQYIYI